MAAFKVNLKILQGETFDPDYVWKTGDPATVVNLTGCTARMQVRPKIASATVMLELTTENGGITLGGTAGTIALLVSAADTADLDPTDANWKTAVYDLEIISAGGHVRRLMSGKVSLSPEVTR